MNQLSEIDSCPPVARLQGLIDINDYAEFASGWKDGIHRRKTNPASTEVVEDLALLLDASSAVDKLNQSE